jgi:hypothetical protein
MHWDALTALPWYCYEEKKDGVLVSSSITTDSGASENHVIVDRCVGGNRPIAIRELNPGHGKVTLGPLIVGKCLYSTFEICYAFVATKYRT